MRGPDLWDTDQVAEAIGVQPATVTVYASRSRRKRRSGRELLPSDLPLPIKIGTRNYWLPDEIRTYLKARAPQASDAGETEVVSASGLRPGHCILDGQGQRRWVQMIREAPARGPRGLHLRIGRSPGAVMGRWVFVRHGDKVTRVIKP